jgi:hypothetical protein
MDYAGRTLASLNSALSRGIASTGRIWEKHPGLAPAWEFPLGALVLLVQHEVGGHGGRAREFGLAPSYGFGSAFSAYTATRYPPRTAEQGLLLAVGGMEADGVLAHRILLDLLRPQGADGAKVPLALMTKLDLTVYVMGTPRPDGSQFIREYRDGNDVATWMAFRQAERLGASPAAVWNGDYLPDLSDPTLDETWHQARATAVWNLLDPSLVAATVAYFREHVLDGRVAVHAPVWQVASGLGLTVGTRAALGPQRVSRFLDLYGATPWGVATVYVRDLESLRDRTWGFGGAVHGLRIGPRAELGFNVDVWDEPESPEHLPRGTSWHVGAEADTRFSRRWGVSAKIGAKSPGFFPGLPLEDGPYGGLGVTASF